VLGANHLTTKEVAFAAPICRRKRCIESPVAANQLSRKKKGRAACETGRAA